MKRAIGIIAALLLIVAVLWCCLTPSWPEFSSTQAKDPQVLVQTAEKDRDYAFHIGDLIEISIFVKQQPGTLVDPESLAVVGDFEVRGKPAVTSKKLEDGSVVYRIKLELQCFKVGKSEIVLDSSMSWSLDGERRDLPIPKTSVYTSNTYDGKRKAIKQGEDARITFYWYGLRHIIPLTVSSLAFLILTFLGIRRFIITRPKPFIDMAKKRALELVGKVKAGTCTKPEHLELDGLIRENRGVGPISVGQMQDLRLPHLLVQFLRLNSVAIYGDTALDGGDRDHFIGLAERMLRDWQVPKQGWFRRRR